MDKQTKSQTTTTVSSLKHELLDFSFPIPLSVCC